MEMGKQIIGSTEIDLSLLKVIGKLRILSNFTGHIKDAQDYIRSGNTQFEDDNYAMIDHIETIINELTTLKQNLILQSEVLINNRNNMNFNLN